MTNPIDAPLGGAGMRALVREREENRRLRERVRCLEAAAIDAANKLIDATEEARVKAKENDNE
ncbi:hypothetical protein [Nocardia nova]|uniref:hypothetical protein n=1 Tax=Nocardia nova TaxID=37330 RepID=UPI0011B0A1E7